MKIFPAALLTQKDIHENITFKTTIEEAKRVYPGYGLFIQVDKFMEVLDKGMRLSNSDRIKEIFAMKYLLANLQLHFFQYEDIRRN